jgi:hypothetical protein
MLQAPPSNCIVLFPNSRGCLCGNNNQSYIIIIILVLGSGRNLGNISLQVGEGWLIFVRGFWDWETELIFNSNLLGSEPVLLYKFWKNRKKIVLYFGKAY